MSAGSRSGGKSFFYTQKAQISTLLCPKDYTFICFFDVFKRWSSNPFQGLLPKLQTLIYKTLYLITNKSRGIERGSLQSFPEANPGEKRGQILISAALKIK